MMCDATSEGIAAVSDMVFPEVVEYAPFGDILIT
jgi:hypothetical protein